MPRTARRTGLVSVLVILFCLRANAGASDDPYQLTETVEVGMSVGMCIFPCPEFQLTIRGDGTVLYEGFAGVDHPGKLTKKIAGNALGPVLAAMKEINFLSISEVPCQARKSDAPTVVLTLKTQHRTHKVRRNLGCEQDRLHENFRQLQNRILTIAAIEDWSSPDTKRDVLREILQLIGACPDAATCDKAAGEIATRVLAMFYESGKQEDPRSLVMVCRDGSYWTRTTRLPFVGAVTGRLSPADLRRLKSLIPAPPHEFEISLDNSRPARNYRLAFSDGKTIDARPITELVFANPTEFEIAEMLHQLIEEATRFREPVDVELIPAAAAVAKIMPWPERLGNDFKPGDVIGKKLDGETWSKLRGQLSSGARDDVFLTLRGKDVGREKPAWLLVRRKDTSYRPVCD